jgi:hypothetical protein
MRHGSYLRHESALCIVTVRNDTNGDMVIGNRKNDARLSFRLVGPSGDTQALFKGARLPASDVVILPGRSKDVEVDLSSVYDLHRVGSYHLAAMISVHGRTHLTRDQVFSVVPGIVVTTARRSVPDHPRILRTYTLRYWARDGENHLFLRVDDEDAKICYGVFALGPIIRTSPPEMTMNVSGALRVSHRSSPKSFTYSSFQVTKDGVIFSKQLVKEIGADSAK